MRRDPRTGRFVATGRRNPVVMGAIVGGLAGGIASTVGRHLVESRLTRSNPESLPGGAMRFRAATGRRSVVVTPNRTGGVITVRYQGGRRSATRHRTEAAAIAAIADWLGG